MMEAFFPGLSSAPNVHPLLVHFPIALWPTALGFWLVALFTGRAHLWAIGRWLLYLGVVGAAAALASGLWAEETLEHGAGVHELIEAHRNWMFAAGGLGVVTAGLAFRARRRGVTDPAWSLVALLMATVIVTALGSDRGAFLVFGHGVGVAAESVEPAEHDHSAHEH